MNIKKRQEVINLMPWYNLGKLSDAEKAMLDEAFAEDPSLKEQLDLDHEIMSKVLADPKLLDRSAFESSTIRLEKVLAQIDDTVVTKIPEKQRTIIKDEVQTTGLTMRVKLFFADLLSGSSHSFTYGVFAALSVVQLALLVFFVVPSSSLVKDDNHYTSNDLIDGKPRLVQGPEATESDNIPNGLVLPLPLKDNILIEGFHSDTLGDLKLKLEMVPGSDGHYTVRLNRELTQQEAEVIENELSHKTAKIVFVGE